MCVCCDFLFSHPRAVSSCLVKRSSSPCSVLRLFAPFFLVSSCSFVLIFLVWGSRIFRIQDFGVLVFFGLGLSGFLRFSVLGS